VTGGESGDGFAAEGGGAGEWDEAFDVVRVRGVVTLVGRLPAENTVEDALVVSLACCEGMATPRS
jgi:hypothetical protein